MFKFKFALVIITIIGSIISQQIPVRVGIRVTESNSVENGSVFALIKHKIQCAENEVLSFWTVKKSTGFLWYKYYCISGPSVTSTSEIKYTQWDQTHKNVKKSLHYLDRHHILCNENQAVGAFELERSGKTIRYKYRCNTIKASSVDVAKTEFVRTGHGEVEGLANIDIAGPKFESNLQALRGWRMHVKYTQQWCTIFCDNFQDLRFDIFYANLN